jgi:hypothetical protein
MNPNLNKSPNKSIQPIYLIIMIYLSFLPCSLFFNSVFTQPKNSYVSCILKFPSVPWTKEKHTWYLTMSRDRIRRGRRVRSKRNFLLHPFLFSFLVHLFIRLVLFFLLLQFCLLFSFFTVSSLFVSFFSLSFSL